MSNCAMLAESIYYSWKKNKKNCSEISPNNNLIPNTNTSHLFGENTLFSLERYFFALFSGFDHTFDGFLSLSGLGKISELAFAG